MSASKALSVVGIVSSVSGCTAVGIGYNKFEEARGFLRSLESGRFFYDDPELKSESVWSFKLMNAQIILLIGGIIAVIGLILLLSGLILLFLDSSHRNKTEVVATTYERPIDNTVAGRLATINELRSSCDITDDEYNSIRQKILSDI